MDAEPIEGLVTRAVSLMDEAVVILDRLGMSAAAAHLAHARNLLDEKRG